MRLSSGLCTTDEMICAFLRLGRALFVAIRIFGKRLLPSTVVWHGLSQKMLFESFGCHFDCPTSTTTQQSVAQTFTGNGGGFILKLKSQYINNCATMLDVSTFSDFTDGMLSIFFNFTQI